jgi:C_GCAxxG_C_C family probable redox protein
MVNIRTAATLLASGLHVEAVKEHIAHIVVAEAEGKIVGAAGLEHCGEGIGLLRSIWVLPGYRNQGIARKLCDAVVARARWLGIGALYLLPTGAEGFFSKHGFARISRARAPDAIRRTQQFSQLCPESAVLMFRSLAAEPGPVAAADPECHSRELFASGHLCAEAVLLAVTKHRGIETPLIPAIATGFCRGLSRTSGMCGALAGGILGLNLVCRRDCPAQSVEQNFAAVQRLVSEFEASCGSTRCSELLGCDLGTPEGQRIFRQNKLQRRCREYTATATRIAVSLSDAKLPENV